MLAQAEQVLPEQPIHIQSHLPTAQQLLLEFTTAPLPSAGDMVKSVYDPTAKNADVFSMANMVEGTTNKIFTATERTKLSGIADNANNYVHPSTHSADIIVDGTTNKVFTATEQAKLAGIASGAEVNVNADWNATEGDAQILNKPTLDSTPTLNSTNPITSG